MIASSFEARSYTKKTNNSHLKMTKSWPDFSLAREAHTKVWSRGYGCAILEMTLAPPVSLIQRSDRTGLFLTTPRGACPIY